MKKRNGPIKGSTDPGTPIEQLIELWISKTQEETLKKILLPKLRSEIGICEAEEEKIIPMWTDYGRRLGKVMPFDRQYDLRNVLQWMYMGLPLEQAIVKAYQHRVFWALRWARSTRNNKLYLKLHNQRLQGEIAAGQVNLFKLPDAEKIQKIDWSKIQKPEGKAKQKKRPHRKA